MAGTRGHDSRWPFVLRLRRAGRCDPGGDVADQGAADVRSDEHAEHLGRQADAQPAVKSGRKEPFFPDGHFYSPICDPEDLRRREEDIWAATDTMMAVEFDVPAQLRLLDSLRPHAADIDYPYEPPDDPAAYYYGNDQYPVLDADFLHALLRASRPARVVEIGSGFSSLVIADVNRRYFEGAIDVTCVEPYPRQFLVDGVEGIGRLVAEKVENLVPEFFEEMEAGDILFIDSSHVAKTGSDVNHLFFNVLPGLKPGTLVHIHDIFLPDDYPKVWAIDENRSWNEQYLVRAFLQYNTEWSVLWAAHFMGTRYLREVQSVFPRYPSLGGGGSLWLRRN